MTTLSSLHEIDQRTNLTANSMFELLLFRLGAAAGTNKHELFGINVFKVREILVMPEITKIPNSHPAIMGVANIRGQMVSVIDLPQMVNCTPTKGLGILLVTEFARTTQAFAVEEVTEIARLEWKDVLSAEGRGAHLITSLAQLRDGDNIRLAQVLDVEQILMDIFPKQTDKKPEEKSKVKLPEGTFILAADDSAVARSMIENGLQEMGLPYVMTKTGKEAWDKIKVIDAEAKKEGKTIRDKVALVLTDIEMPEMDGFTLTRNIKQDVGLKQLPVIIHSSLTGSANENHVKTAGANAYIAKFVAADLERTIKNVLMDAG